MPFESVRFHNFRNIQNGQIPVACRQVFFIGENGQGKTNFLEAIYTLCYGKSFRTSTDQILVTHEQVEMALIGNHVDANNMASTIKVNFRNGRKEIICDEKNINDRKVLVERYPCVVFCHDDLEFVRGGPESQRLFFDQTASLLYPEYLGNLRDYQKTLKSRNALLKEQRTDLLEPYNQQLVRFGQLLMAKRNELTGIFNRLFTPLFELVSGGISGISIEYRPNWQQMDAEAVMQRLRDRVQTDLALKSTTTGAHRDKFFFLRDSADFSDSASTGQFRLMSLLMRLAQASLIESLRGRRPILLLDDVLLELDFDKRKRFLEALPPHEQAFFTFLPDEAVGEYAKEGALIYHTENGGFHEKGR